MRNLYGAVHSGFDAGKCLYAGKWEAVEAWKSRIFRPCEMAASRQASAI